MSKGMRLFIRRMLWWKGPSDSYFFWGGVSLLACSSAPFALFLTNASHTQPPFIGGGRSCWRNFVEPYRCEWGLIKLKIESGKLKVRKHLDCFVAPKIVAPRNDLALDYQLRVIARKSPIFVAIHSSVVLLTTANDVQSNACHSLSFNQFYMERVPKAGEGVINFKSSPTRISKLRTAQLEILPSSVERAQLPCTTVFHAKESKTTLNFPLSTVNLSRRCA